MNDAKWGEIVDRVADSFGIKEQGREELTDVPNGYVEFIVFDSPMGHIRLEREVTPKVEGTHVSGGSKYGAGSLVEKIYSDSETVKTFMAWKEVDGEWERFEFPE